MNNVRLTKRQQIEQFFVRNVTRRFGTKELHEMFGTAFRTRVSEINRSESASVSIRNEVNTHDDHETSVYWAEVKSAAVLA